MTVQERIEQGDDQVDGIKNFFARWSHDTISLDRENTSHAFNNLDVGDGQICVLHNASGTSRHARVYVKVGGKVLLIGVTQVDVTDNNIRGSFLGAKGTKFEGIKMSFHAHNIDDLDLEAQSWIKKQLSIHYPDDYEPQNKLSEKEEEYTHELDGIKFTLRFGIDGIKEVSIRLEIGDEIFEINDFSSSTTGRQGNQTFTVWIKPKGNAEKKVIAQLKNRTKSSHKDFKKAIHQMLRNVKRLLETKDTQKILLAHEIRKYKVSE